MSVAFLVARRCAWSFHGFTVAQLANKLIDWSWIMSLHYLVKLEILITHVLPLHCQRKKLQKFPTSTVASKFARFESSWFQRVGNTAGDDVLENTLIWMNWNSIRYRTINDWERSCPSWITSSYCNHSVALSPISVRHSKLALDILSIVFVIVLLVTLLQMLTRRYF